MNSIFAALVLLALPGIAQAESNFFALPIDSGAGLFRQCSREAPRQPEILWSPAPEQIAALEHGLEPYLKTNSPHPLESPLTKFRRQYIGFTKDGKRYIYGNFYVASLHPKNEDTQAVVVCDGGSLFCGVVYDVESETFQDLKFNGFA